MLPYPSQVVYPPALGASYQGVPGGMNAPPGLLPAFPPNAAPLDLAMALAHELHAVRQHSDHEGAHSADHFRGNLNQPQTYAGDLKNLEPVYVVPSGCSSLPQSVMGQGAPSAPPSTATPPPSEASSLNDRNDRETLRSILEKLRNEDPKRIFVVRHINKLGFRSRKALERHFQRYGEVEQVLVAHSKANKAPMIADSFARQRPGNLGLVVMRRVKGVHRILALGSEQLVCGVPVTVHPFVPPGGNPNGTGACEEEAAADPPLADLPPADQKSGQKGYDGCGSQSSTCNSGSQESPRDFQEPSCGTWERQETASSNCTTQSAVLEWEPQQSGSSTSTWTQRDRKSVV